MLKTNKKQTVRTNQITFRYNLFPPNKNNPKMNRDKIQSSRNQNIEGRKKISCLFSNLNIMAQVISKPVH